MDENVVEISAAEYVSKIEDLISIIRELNLDFDQVIGIAVGGNIPATWIAKKFRKPLILLRAKSYHPVSDGCIVEQRGEIKFASDLFIMDDEESAGPSVLLIDDLTQSGETIRLTIQWLKNHYPEISKITTAVIWHKEVSDFSPDIYVEYVPVDENGKCPWIKQPFEPDEL